MELDEIKNMWNNQKLSQISGQNGILSSIASIEKKTKRKYIIATVAMGLEFIIFVFLIFSQDYFTGISLAGILLILTAIILGISSIWSTNILFREKDLLNPGISFLKNVVEKLNRRRYIRIYLIPAYLIMIAFGVTMIFSQMLEVTSLFWKIFIYSVTYLYIILIYIITAKKEIKKEKEQTEPIKKKIMSIIYQMESD